ncbi:MAG: hypothetical protein ACT4P3_18660 [Betaproteobacteria bacterium]
MTSIEDFYTRVLGFAVTDRDELGSAAFNPINRVSFRLSELAALRQMAQRLK